MSTEPYLGPALASHKRSGTKLLSLQARPIVKCRRLWWSLLRSHAHSAATLFIWYVNFLFLHIVCLPIYIYAYTYLYIYLSILHLRIHIPIYIYTCIYIYLYISTPAYTYTYIYLCISIYTPIYLYIQTAKHTYIHLIPPKPKNYLCIHWTKQFTVSPLPHDLSRLSAAITYISASAKTKKAWEGEIQVL